MQSRTLKKDKESREEGRRVEKNISLIKNNKKIYKKGKKEQYQAQVLIYHTQKRKLKFHFEDINLKVFILFAQ